MEINPRKTRRRNVILLPCNYIKPLKSTIVSPYLKENTTLQRYKDQLVNAVQGDNRRLKGESYKIHEHKMQSD
jgi:hypothetical protein